MTECSLCNLTIEVAVLLTLYVALTAAISTVHGRPWDVNFAENER